MNTTLKKLALAAFASVALVPFAVADLEKYLPSGKTLALAKIENVAALEKYGNTNPLAVEMKTKLIAPIFAAATKDVSDQEAQDFAKAMKKLETLTAAFPGEVVIALLDAGVKDKKPVCGALIADCAEGTDLEKITEMYKEGYPGTLKDIKIKVGKSEIPAKKAKDEAFAVVDGKFILAEKTANLRQIAKAIKLGGKMKSVAASAIVYETVRKRMGNADIWLCANGALIAKKIYAAAEDYDKKLAEEMKEDPSMAMFSVMTTPIVKAFAPEAIDTIWWSVSYTENGAVSEGAISWNENKGLASLLTASIKDGFEKPTLFPPSENLVSIGASSFSVGAFVNRLMGIAREASPLFGIVDMQLMNLKATENVDVPAILTALGNGSFTYSLSANEPESTVWVQTVSDKAPVAVALEKLAETLGSKVVFTKTEATAGTPEIYTFTGDFEQDGTVDVASAVFLGDKLCLGPKETVDQIISQYAKGKDAPSAWDNAKIKAGEALLPPGGSGLSYLHLGKMISGIVDYAQETAATLEDGELALDDDSQKAVADVFSELKIEAGDFDYSVISKTYLKDKELSAKTVIYKN